MLARMELLTDKTNAGFARDIQLELERMKFVYENGVYRLRPKKIRCRCSGIAKFHIEEKGFGSYKKTGQIHRSINMHLESG